MWAGDGLLLIYFRCCFCFCFQPLDGASLAVVVACPRCKKDVQFTDVGQLSVDKNIVDETARAKQRTFQWAEMG